MKHHFIVLLVAFSLAIAFHTTRHLFAFRKNVMQLSMGRRKRPFFNKKNYPRKMKRRLKTANSTEALAEILLNPEFEGYLRYNSSYQMHDALMHRINKRCRKLGYVLPPNWGYRPPRVKPTTLEYLTKNGSFTQLINCINLSQIPIFFQPRANYSERYTLLAPTDDAFAKLKPGVLDGFLKDPQKLLDLLHNHLGEGNEGYKKIIAAGGINVLYNEKAHTTRIDKRDNSINMAGIKFMTTNTKCSDGIIHSVDGVFIPK